MNVIRKIRFFFRSAFVPMLCLLLTFYFAYHAIVGEHGLRRMFQLKEELKVTRKIADEIRSQRDQAQERVKMLSPDGIDMDVLDESARATLNLSDEKDFVIFADE